ncbi:MAG TPA: hypothetical protein ENO05_09535 [Bacteroides sp.]|nr:hypothetical protein [Bacteroides sp.]
MRHSKLAIILLLFIWNGLLSQEPARKLSLDLSRATFNEFVDQFETRTGIRVYFRPDWFGEIRVDYRRDSVTPEEAIREVLKGTGLHYGFVSSSAIVILPERRLNTSLPEILSVEALQGSSDAKREYMGINGSQYIQGTRPEQITRTITVGDPSSRTSRSVARVKGKLVHVETGEPVAGATMVILESGKGGISDQYGNVAMALAPGRYSAQFSFIGMEKLNAALEVYSDGEFKLEMRPAVIALNEVQILGEQYRDISSTDIGVERFSMKSLKQLPVFMGERDVIKISKLLPGITSAGEASTGVNVRGGNVDQNIFYINRLPVYNTSHLFGFFSAFNSDIIRDFSVYKGNVPVNYGGRLSSVFNILTRKGNNKIYTAHAGISPVSAHLTFEGPLRKDHSSFIVSGRSSYSDWILRRIDDPEISNSDAFFYDVAASMNFEPGEKNTLQLFYYQSFDDFRYAELTDYEYANRGGSLNWSRNISPALTSKVTATASAYRFRNADKSEISRAYSHEYLLNHNEVLADFTWVPAIRHSVEFGSNLIYYRLDRGVVEPYGPSSIRKRLDLGFEHGVEGSFFISDDMSLLSWLNLYGGFRYSYYSKLGPETVMLYESGKPKTENTIVDSLSFGKFSPVRFNSGPELRIAMNMKGGQNTSFKLAFNQMRQYLFMLSNTVTISPTDQWKLSDYHIDPQTGYQFSAGAYHIFPGIGVSGSVELYYKYSKDIVEYRDGADFVNIPLTETQVLQGSQNAYGAELMLQKTSGRLNGWINYTLSRSEMLVAGDTESESINHGNPYPSNYDRPHVLNLVANYHVNRRFSVASNVVFMSGRPVTFPASLYYIKEVAYIDYYARNEFRVPDYFRVDLSLTVEGNLKAEKLMHSTWSFNVYNLLGRKNPQSIFFRSEDFFVRGYAFSVIGVPVFTLSWNVKLGNYESN